ncbi:MAG TPA: response regulator transcription factor [Arachnia sp.]|nr:response regulator transcription factor [Arachnia sp.]HMT85970.1 response regulator transcription factor [Arachnia sp.]
MKARIGIVDDHPSMLLGVRTIINPQPDLQIVAGATTVARLLHITTHLDIVLLDLVLADGSTPTGNIATLTEAGVPVLVYTTGDQPHLVREASVAGAIGMIRKAAVPDVIVNAVRTALRGDIVASADWAAALDYDTEFVAARLSAREAEVLALYASGETAERVAKLLFISRDTVIDHIRRIRSKYAALERPAHTKLDLYHRAVEDGIVDRSR